MSRILMLLSAILLVVVLVGCGDDEDTVYDPAPPTPQGVYSITGDNAVYIYWAGPYDRDIREYVIWRSFDQLTNYQAIGSVDADDNPNLDLIYYQYIDYTAVNGNTYFYAVTAVDAAGQSSELSAEDVFDTPRPEGEVTLYDMAVNADAAGFNFATGSVVARTSSLADVFIDSDVNGQLYVNAGDVDNLDTEIQDMGYTSVFYEIGWAPQTGWSMLGWAQVIGGHTYVVRTDDLHYAKLRVTAFDEVAGTVTFEYAYQTDQNNPELTPARPANTDAASGTL
ncbi:MAG TPA: HmuY family protein [candidate division Zixibacteria bacterium]|nr:HmuY family protein [candidate division Zixibacteria bacterium]